MRSYLGDALYMEDDGFRISLYTLKDDDGSKDIINEIHLDPHVLKNFMDCMASSRSLNIVVTQKVPTHDLTDEMSQFLIAKSKE